MESLFAQTRLPDEIVVADGCSTDDTVKQIECSAIAGAIRVVRNESRYAAADETPRREPPVMICSCVWIWGIAADSNWLSRWSPRLRRTRRSSMSAASTIPSSRPVRESQRRSSISTTRWG